jgi:hypothetical protein
LQEVEANATFEMLFYAYLKELGFSSDTWYALVDWKDTRDDIVHELDLHSVATTINMESDRTLQEGLRIARHLLKNNPEQQSTHEVRRRKPW